MKRVYRDERGSSLVMTIIAMTFISILAVAVIAMTVTNIRLKQAQRQSQKNFYNADSIVDAVRAGLYDLAAKSAEESYEEAIITYGADGASMKKAYTEKFFAKMLKALYASNAAYDPTAADVQDGTATYYYDDDVIRSYLTQAQIDGSLAAGDEQGYLSHGPTLTDIYDTASSCIEGCGLVEYDMDSLLLKEVVVMKTERDYQTKIKTDIRVSVPNITQETDPEYLTYALIADNQIRVEDSGGIKEVNGSVYAGTSKRHCDTNRGKEPEAGLIVKNATLDLNADHVVTRGDILLYGNGTSKLNIKGRSKTANVWAENIESKDKQNALTVNADCYISDDLELWGKNDSASFSGEYYGYNYAKAYPSPSEPASTQSEYSSAILLNGLKNNLNLSGLKHLSLAGTTFISKNLNIYDLDDASQNESLAGGKTNQDIAMGESMTVKGTQMAYYVPSDYVKSGTSTDADAINFTLNEGGVNNPYYFDKKGYNAYMNQGKSVADFDVANYINNPPSGSNVATIPPVVCYYRNDIKVKGDIQYFYLNFKDEAAADKFYADYKKYQPYDDVEHVNDSFIGNNGIILDVDGAKHGTAVLSSVGNILYTQNGDSDVQLLLKGDSDKGNTIMYKNAAMYSREYMSMQMALTKEYDKVQDRPELFRLDFRSPSAIAGAEADAALGTVARKNTFSKSGDAYTDAGKRINVPASAGGETVDTLKTNLFATLIDEEKFLNGGYNNDPEIIDDYAKKDDGTEDADGGRVVLVRNDKSHPFKLTQSFINNKLAGKTNGLILVNEDIEIEAGFKGLIIAGGDIKMNTATDIKVEANAKMLRKIFSADKEKGAGAKFSHLFKDYFITAISSSISGGDEQKDTVEYEDWKKNWD